VAKNPKLIIGVLVALLAVVGGYFGFNYYKKIQNAEAQKEMFQAQRYWESDSLNLALNGDGNNLGLLQIIDNYGMSEAANLANYLVGDIYLKQGKYSLAVFHLKEFKASDLLVQAR
ncbi:MAG: cytochrome C biosynthesis protein, partial [Flammeovirgaceae bacterium]